MQNLSYQTSSTHSTLSFLRLFYGLQLTLPVQVLPSKSEPARGLLKRLSAIYWELSLIGRRHQQHSLTMNMSISAADPVNAW